MYLKKQSAGLITLPYMNSPWVLGNNLEPTGSFKNTTILSYTNGPRIDSEARFFVQKLFRGGKCKFFFAHCTQTKYLTTSCT